MQQEGREGGQARRGCACALDHTADDGAAASADGHDVEGCDSSAGVAGMKVVGSR